MSKTALLTGATGLVGGLVLEQLLSSPGYAQVIAVTRRPLTQQHPKLRNIVTELERLETAVAGKNIDDVYCCLGTTMKTAGSKEAFRKVDYTYVLNTAKAGRAAGAAQFMLVSAVGASAKSGVFYSRTKGEAERDVASLGFSAVHIFQPSFLLGDRHENRPGEKMGIGFFKLLEPALLGPLGKYHSVEAADVARAMLAAARSGQKGVHKYEYAGILRLVNG